MLRVSLLGLGMIMSASAALAADLSFIERFALAANREDVLKELIPGTEDYYYFHCLHYQNQKQFDRVDELLTRWIARHKETALAREILYRQAALTYDESPEKTLQFLKDRLKLRFAHQADTPDSRPDLPEQLDQALISFDRLRDRAMRQHRDLDGFSDAALRRVAAMNLDANRLRDLLQRLERPDVDGLPKLIVTDLRNQGSRGFGSHKIHGRLLLDQLAECARLMPELTNDSDFVNAWLARLRPGNDIDLRNSTTEYDAYLTRLTEFVRTLSPAYNSLKAVVLYHRLDFGRRQGRYNKELFLEYIQIPRRAIYMDRDFMRRDTSRRHQADLSADYHGATTLAIVRVDDALVREYLMEFLKDANDTLEFDAWLDDTWLKHVFAESKIVNGVGDAEQWYALLPPEQHRQLRDRIDIDFAPTNKQYFAADDAVSLDVFVKNVPSLLVKVFEVNAANYYRDFKREVNTDINLDGLVANREETFDYNEPPMRRVKRHFEFPELNKRGVYVIDFIGNGRSSRALIRKGRLATLSRATVAGTEFTVFDEQHRQVKTASIQFGARTFEPDDDGRILIPYSTHASTESIVIRDGDFVAIEHFKHSGESWNLEAGLFVDREQLLPGRTAELVIRPQVTVNGTPVSLRKLDEVTLTIQSTDLDGTNSSTTVSDLELFEDRETIHEFTVPNRLSHIEFQLTAKIRVRTTGKTETVAARRSFEINGIESSSQIDDVFLTRIEDRYYADVLGRSGEPRAQRPVSFRFRHRDFSEEFAIELRSDASGRVDLGPLNGITDVSTSAGRHWSLEESGASLPRVIHGQAGRSIRIPAVWPAGELSRERLSVLELRANAYTKDLFEVASLEGGYVVLSDLEAGDYSVQLTSDNGATHNLTVRIAEGSATDRFVTGDSRYLEVADSKPLQIETVTHDDSELTVRLNGHDQFARVHVFANTFLPDHSHFGSLAGISHRGLRSRKQTPVRSYYVEGREIGDELRYILERRSADRFPGNMNERPAVLLNPWAVRSTQTDVQDAQRGTDFGKSNFEAPQSEAPSSRMEAADQAQRGQIAQENCLDFLSTHATVLPNLLPDDDGVLKIDLDAFPSHHHLHIVAVDPTTTVWRSHSLPERTNKALDLRLARTLEPEKGYSQQRQVSVTRAGDEFLIEDLRSSKFVLYGSLDRVFQLFLTLNPNAGLEEFRFLLEWPTTSDEKKRELYSKHACHELNFFLLHKDPEFFAEVIRPYLENKFDKTFLDDWLLDRDLSRFVEPWHYHRLNALEKILLARRMDGDAIRRNLDDRLAMLPIDVGRQQHLFGTSLLGGALDSGVMTGGGMGGFGGGAAAYGDVAGKSTFESDADAIDFGAFVRRGGQQRSKSEALSKLRRPSVTRGRDLNDGVESKLDYFDDDMEEIVPQLFRQMEKTQEWAENNYRKLKISEQTASLVKVNRFWSDYAHHDHATPFVSANVAEATANFAEMILALSVLDLPFEAAASERTIDGVKLTLKPAGPTIIVHEQIKPARSADGSMVLVSQNFFNINDRFRSENNQQVEKFIDDEFVVHTVYGGQIVVTNPSSVPRLVSALIQVPAGSVPVAGAHYTRSVPLQLGPHETETVEYQFYFPEAGDFAHYPVHVAREEAIIAMAEPFRFHVVNEPTSIDRESWDYVSQYASTDEVLRFLREENLQRFDLARIAWRMRDAEFFDAVTELLSDRLAWNHTLWSYAVFHNRREALSEYLRHTDQYLKHCGLSLSCPLLTIDPVERGVFEHLEYKPLINARTHRLGADRKILNDRFREQYARQMKRLTYHATLSDRDLLAVSYYLLLQDRIREALMYFERIDPDQLSARMQHDYFAAYTDFFTDGLDIAKRMVDRYTGYPVDKWRTAFADMDAQIREVESGRPGDQESPHTIDPEQRERDLVALADDECSFDVSVESTEVQLDYQNLDKVRINYYLMDIELLFSRNPFVQGYSGHFAHIKPNMTESRELPAEESAFAFELPAELQNRNVLVEVVGRGKTHTAAYYSNSLSLTVSENYGQIRVVSADGEQSLPRVYVKAYARMQDGRIRFYKDGYTDLRGRFDYASLSTNELDSVERFALLVMSDKHGAIVREVAPPKR